MFAGGGIDVVRGVHTGATPKRAGFPSSLLHVVGEGDNLGILKYNALVLDAISNADFVVGKERVLDGQYAREVGLPSRFSTTLVDSNIVKNSRRGWEISLPVGGHPILTYRVSDIVSKG